MYPSFYAPSFGTGATSLASTFGNPSFYTDNIHLLNNMLGAASTGQATNTFGTGGTSSFGTPGFSGASNFNLGGSFGIGAPNTATLSAFGFGEPQQAGATGYLFGQIPAQKPSFGFGSRVLIICGRFPSFRNFWFLFPSVLGLGPEILGPRSSVETWSGL